MTRMRLTSMLALFLVDAAYTLQVTLPGGGSVDFVIKYIYHNTFSDWKTPVPWASSTEADASLNFPLRKMQGRLGLRNSAWMRWSFQAKGGFRQRKLVWKILKRWLDERVGWERRGINWPLFTSSTGLDGSGVADVITNTNLALSLCLLPGVLELNLSYFSFSSLSSHCAVLDVFEFVPCKHKNIH